MRLVDTHCHLYDERAFPHPADTVLAARNAGIDRMVVIGIDADTSRRAIALAERLDGVFAVVGWHPNHAAQFEGIDEIRDLSRHPKVVAIGEIGLDYYWDHATPDQQRSCLRAHLDLAYETGKPIVYHCRDAYDDLVSLLENEPRHPSVFHCFAGDEGHLKRCLALGAMFGVDGPVTFPKNDALRAQFARIPADRILIETDSPYMAPVPYRGKSNQPAYVAHVNEALAKARGISTEECAALTTGNAERFFALPA
jgi:TatD DNase family protein